ncbi:MAG: YihY/virulence factor BrkB family protein [Acidobacteria bacterium]|nr:YihY/virulence factor BrkB family protein [Acidobacteriota bacterium]MBI3423551.1 YihY/virulence factor BrkB family protein [Acidobacteriota bacterium]
MESSEAESLGKQRRTGPLSQSLRLATAPAADLLTPAPLAKLPLVAPVLQHWRTIAREVYCRIFEDEIFGRAAQLAYYWLFSIFPLLIFLTALLAYLPMPRFFENLFDYLHSMLPPPAFALLNTTFQQITSQPRGGLLSFGILVSIWASANGMEAIITALNTAYDVETRRAWWRERLLALQLTLGLALFVITALGLLFFGEHIGERLAQFYGYGGTFRTFWNLARWAGIIGFISLALALLYYIAPNLKQRWREALPGALFALGGWLLVTFGFKFYVMRFGNYNATYGALGGVMVLMLWLYLTGVAILLGGEINSVLSQLKRQLAATSE